MGTTDRWRAPRNGDGAAGPPGGFEMAAPAPASRRRRVVAVGLAAAALAGSVTACARYAPWLRPAGGVDEVGAGPAVTRPPASTTTVPPTTAVPVTDVATTVTEVAPEPPTTAAPTATTNRTPATAAATRPARPATPAPARGAAAPTADAGWQGEMLADINRERANAGLRPLTACGTLNRAAQGYADAMAASGVMSHTGADGSTMQSRITAAGYTMARGSGSLSYAENIAQGYPTVDAVMAGWMGSAGHRANLLAPGTTHVGVGRHGTWWVQDFGSGGTC